MKTTIVRFTRPTVSSHPSNLALKHLQKELDQQRVSYSGWVTDGGERGVLIVPEPFFRDNKSIFESLEDPVFEEEVSR